MKKSMILTAVAAVLLCACSSDKPVESQVAKDKVELAGNVFSSFSLGDDVKLYTVQNPANSSEWTIQAVAPISKNDSTQMDSLTIDLVPLNDKGVRIREGFVLQGEDMANLIPVFNTGEKAARNVVFSIADGDKKYMSAKEAAQLLEQIMGVRMNFNGAVANAAAEQEEAVDAEQTADAQEAADQTVDKQKEQKAEEAKAAPKEYPKTVDGLCQKYGIYGQLAQYESALRSKNKKRAKQIEDHLWEIEKRVKKDASIPENVRSSFVRYIENKEDEIEDKY